MKLVERHIVKDNRFEDVCLKSGLLYNYVLYSIRQGIFSGNYLKEFDLSNKLCKENQFDFRNLPNHVSRQVIKQVFKNIKSRMRLKKDFEKNPSKYGNHRPHLPSYKKGKKQNMVVFTNCDCRIKDDGYIHFVKNTIKPIKTNVKKDELKQVRIIPQATCYVVEVVYERRETDLGLGLSLLRPRERHRPAGVSLDVEMKFVSSTLASIQDWEGIDYDCRRISRQKIRWRICFHVWSS